ncbi:MAG: prolyl oligopeptidase family serine peptidase [Candidatus Hydrogenedentes bacterium]|nr:prolyl oligopeptidase family serine peptidase [Candidatus Hydrogenedentota bacterium]
MTVVFPLYSWGQTAREVTITSTVDDSEQAAMFYAPEASGAVPLVVVLHTWLGDYRQDAHKAVEEWCMKKGWAYIHPDFRGPNIRPEATGSEQVLQDILDAVTYARKEVDIDDESIFLVGTSGGGYTALLMAGRYPEIWAGVSVWVPIVDLTAWYHECKEADIKYFEDVEASCGGIPGASPAVDKEYRKRSPLTWLSNAKGLHLHINAGIRDGHDGSVPVSHTLLAFNEVAAPRDKISPEDICFFVDRIQVPKQLKKKINDPTYGEKQPLFRRCSGNTMVTIFDGAHDFIPEAALAWIESIKLP